MIHKDAAGPIQRMIGSSPCSKKTLPSDGCDEAESQSTENTSPKENAAAFGRIQIQGSRNFVLRAALSSRVQRMRDKKVTASKKKAV